MKVNTSHKKLLKTGVIHGLSFATGMAVFDHFDKEPFSIAQFIFYFIFFGGSMTYIFRHQYKKRPDN